MDFPGGPLGRLERLGEHEGLLREDASAVYLPAVKGGGTAFGKMARAAINYLAGAGERRPGQRERLRNDYPAQRVGPAGVAVGVIKRADLLGASQSRAPELGVGRAHYIRIGIFGQSSVGRGGEDGDVVAQPP